MASTVRLEREGPIGWIVFDIAACFVSGDFAEGRRAFADKRQPVFRGR